MKKRRFSEEQIIGVLKEAEAGAKVPDLARKHGISDGTSSAGGRNTAASRCPKGEEDGKRVLKRLVSTRPRTSRCSRTSAQRSGEARGAARGGVVPWRGPRGEQAPHVRAGRYENEPLEVQALMEAAANRKRWGDRMLTVRLRWQGLKNKRKQSCRMDREERLRCWCAASANLPPAWRRADPVGLAQRPVVDGLRERPADLRARIRAFNVIDGHTRDASA